MVILILTRADYTVFCGLWPKLNTSIYNSSQSPDSNSNVSIYTRSDNAGHSTFELCPVTPCYATPHLTPSAVLFANLTLDHPVAIRYNIPRHSPRLTKYADRLHYRVVNLPQKKPKLPYLHDYQSIIDCVRKSTLIQMISASIQAVTHLGESEIIISSQRGKLENGFS